jgi:hypothetical protein
MPITPQKVVRQVWIFWQYSLKMTDKIVSLPLCSDRSNNAQLAICGGEESGH